MLQLQGSSRIANCALFSQDREERIKAEKEQASTSVVSTKKTHQFIVFKNVCISPPYYRPYQYFYQRNPLTILKVQLATALSPFLLLSTLFSSEADYLHKEEELITCLSVILLFMIVWFSLLLIYFQLFVAKASFLDVLDIEHCFVWGSFFLVFLFLFNNGGAVWRQYRETVNKYIPVSN